MDGFTPFSVAGPADPLPVMMATEAGYLAWNTDPIANTGSSALTLGTVMLSRINIRYAMAVSKVSCAVSVGGGTLTAGQNWLGLYSSAGVLIGQTADQTTNFGTGGLLVIAPLTGGPFNLLAGTFVWVAFLTNGTTAPNVLRIATSSVNQNANLPLGQSRAVFGPAAQTVLPASIAIPGGLVLSNSFPAWCALS